MERYRITVYAQPQGQDLRLLRLARLLAAGQRASVEVLSAPDAIDCAGAQLELQGIEATCRAIEPGAQSLLQASCCADLLLLGQPPAESPRSPHMRLASQLLMDSTCPLLFQPRLAELGNHAGTTILAAWDGGRQSARALRDALPLLRRARSVRIHAYGSAHSAAAQSLPAACAFLQRHGVQAQCALQGLGDTDYAASPPMTPVLRDAGVAELLLSDAAELGADLLVMGAYGHSRAQEWLLGGVTRAVLCSMTLPVLMSH